MDYPSLCISGEDMLVRPRPLRPLQASAQQNIGNKRHATYFAHPPDFSALAMESAGPEDDDDVWSTWEYQAPARNLTSAAKPKRSTGGITAAQEIALAYRRGLTIASIDTGSSSSSSSTIVSTGCSQLDDDTESVSIILPELSAAEEVEQDYRLKFRQSSCDQLLACVSEVFACLISYISDSVIPRDKKLSQK